MMASVPQNIDVEDKVAGPLTWKQIFWMIGMGAVLMVFYSLFDTQLFFISAVPTILLFVALAFYKPNGMPMIVFIMHGVLFLFRPKLAVWERPVARPVLPKKMPENVSNQTVSNARAEKNINAEKLRELAAILDRRNR